MPVYLDPSEAHLAIKTWKPDEPVPLNIRNWGYCADFSTWLPGDLILVSAITPNLVQSAIRKVQGQGYANEHARWEHAAVYIGESALCEATMKGVRVGNAYQYLRSHLIKLRRNPNLTNDQRWNLAVNALKLQDRSYGFGSIIELLWKAHTTGFWASGISMYSKRTRICSELYADAHAKVSRLVVGNINSGITPASLSAETKLVDVKTQWVIIE